MKRILQISQQLRWKKLLERHKLPKLTKQEIQMTNRNSLQARDARLVQSSQITVMYQWPDWEKKAIQYGKTSRHMTEVTAFSSCSGWKPPAHWEQKGTSISPQGRLCTTDSQHQTSVLSWDLGQSKDISPTYWAVYGSPDSHSEAGKRSKRHMDWKKRNQTVFINRWYEGLSRRSQKNTKKPPLGPNQWVDHRHRTKDQYLKVHCIHMYQQWTVIWIF